MATEQTSGASPISQQACRTIPQEALQALPPSHCSLPSMMPLPQTGASVVVVVVVGTAQPRPAQASQQLANALAQPPPASHFAGVVALQRDVPSRRGKQQATIPGRPHDDCAAHFFTVPIQVFGNVPASTRDLSTAVAQRTYAPFDVAAAQSQAASTAARAPATAAASVHRAAKANIGDNRTTARKGSQ